VGLLLVCAVAALFVFVGCRFVGVRLTFLGYLGAGALAAGIGMILMGLLQVTEPLALRIDLHVIPIVTLLIGAVIVVLLLKFFPPLR
jgi:hypothetical protein